MTRAFVAFGSNIDPERHVVEAIRRLAELVRLLRVSPIYETPPVGAPGAPAFLNGVVEIETELPRERLIADVLRAVEDQLGRRRTANSNAPRTIDLDLILFGGEMHADPARHAHVAVPLADLVPDWIHPLQGASMAVLRARFKGEEERFRRRPDVDPHARHPYPQCRAPE
ncbi:MAG: 2-amino-4-hydroxy-6-hydroxymethyldihydropteridine diphosphokinase [Planctomycetes bacterium]|nr:2-amino-4-hydroxy-6-hydroxymethyldihydropteridine diphosphokinase [Planctomycetota bacterium]